MKKALLLLIFSLFSVNVYALEECKTNEIEQGQEALKNVSYELSYADDYTDRIGNFQEGYMKLFAKGLPEGYIMVVYTGEAYSEIRDTQTYIEVQGGVHRVEYYSDACTTPIKTFEIKVPYYKLFCDVDKKCEENVFFDGTYPNTASNQNAKPKPTVSTVLVVILIILIAIIVGFIVIVIKRRKSHVVEL